jgi:squalene-hopene/tetraprenyl-beta-curcumene cyclase
MERGPGIGLIDKEYEMKRIKWIAMSALAAGVFVLAACGGANNAAKPAAGNNDGNAAANETANAGGNEGTDNNGTDNNGTENNGNHGADVSAKRDAIVEKAWGYLKGMYEKDDNTLDENQVGVQGSWGPKTKNIPYTAMVLLSAIGTDYLKPSDPMFKDSVNFLLDSQNDDGSWSYAPAQKGMRALYVTSIAVRLCVALNKADGAWKGKLNDAVAKGRDYIKQSQVGNADGPAPDYDRNKVGFGGWAYSKEEITHAVKERGKPASNMSTSTFAIDALHACGVEPGDPMFKNALVFLKRNQNAGELQEEGFKALYKNDKKIKPAEKGDPNYGGSHYSEETSKPGVHENEDGSVTLLSYGTMTYNLLRDYLFAGLKKDDLPVKLAWGWIQRNYTVERVPGYAEKEKYHHGLYYYYFSMAQTLQAMDVDTVEEPDRDLKHDWRADLVGALESRQSDDGSWVNHDDEWQENSPMLCTLYALIALRHTEK